MQYVLYKITNNINKKIYVGVHKTADIDDGYMGSGKLLKRAQAKYGIENFTKEILEVYDNPDDMYEAEARVVNEEFVASAETYNMKEGGLGGWANFEKTESHKEKIRRAIVSINADRLKRQQQLLETDPVWKENFCKRISEGVRRRYKNGAPGSFTGKTHSDATKRAIGRKNSILQRGNNNSQYGTMWICNVLIKENRKIKKSEKIPDGWIRGRNKWKL